MSLTPLHITIALHYHCMADPYPNLHIEIHRRYAEHLAEAGLLRETVGPVDASVDYEPTEALAVFVDALCSTPFPVQKWVMP